MRSAPADPRRVRLPARSVWIDENNSGRVINAFIDKLDLAEFEGVEPTETVKLYNYGYLNRVQSSRRFERETGRNVEVMWLLGRLVADHKTVADFRKGNGRAIRKVCARFVELCGEMGSKQVRDSAVSMTDTQKGIARIGSIAQCC